MAKRFTSGWQRLAIVGLVCALPLPAYAETAAFCFAGTVTSEFVDFAEVAQGDVVTGSFNYDMNSADEMPGDQDTGVYDGIELETSITGASYLDAEPNISVGDNTTFASFAPVDLFEISTGTNIAPGFMFGPSGPNLSGMPIAQINIVLLDTDASVFGDDTLPTSVDLGQFEIVDESPTGTTGGRLIFSSSTAGFVDIRFAISILRRVAEAALTTGEVSIPAIQVGGQVFAVTLRLVPGTNPLQFEITGISPSPLPASPDNATFTPATGIARLPVVRLPGGVLIDVQLQLIPASARLQLAAVDLGSCM